MELPRFVVVAIENAAAGTIDDKVAWLNDQRQIMSDEEARARAEAVLGVQDDDAWALLQQLADESQAVEALPQVDYGAPEGWRYSLVTGELVPVNATVEELTALTADQGLTTEQLAAEAERAEIIAVSDQSLEDKIAYVNAQLENKNEAQVRAEIEAVLGKQDDAAWGLLTSMAAQERAPVILQPPASPSTPKAPILPSPINKPFIVPGTTPTVKSETTKDETMQRTIGNQPLPAGWDQYSAIQKITWFNRNNITPAQLKAEGVSDSDIAWMRSNGYIVGTQTSGLNPVLIAAAAAYFLIGS